MVAYLLALLGTILLPVGDIVLRDVMEHVRHSTPGGHRVDSNLLVAAVLGEDAHKGVDGALGARVQRMPGYAEILGGVGRHQYDTPALVQVAVGLASHKELAACVEAEDTVELFLGHVGQVPEAHHTRVAADDV